MATISAQAVNILYFILFYGPVLILGFAFFIAFFTVVFIFTPSEWTHPYYDTGAVGFGGDHIVNRGYRRRPPPYIPPRIIPPPMRARPPRIYRARGRPRPYFPIYD
ncbi:hypothetical protein Dda_2402 [Drechslerella dactyloides]|uniref:Uncharacterized protein n=1 Tax=Drechslerella dactyloides TaxID=74499 RepID=A0AAD6NMZ7_DREDA|nr:hypothetical protein Dda_2402 [Drechslerella dactyloides]